MHGGWGRSIMCLQENRCAPSALGLPVPRFYQSGQGSPWTKVLQHQCMTCAQARKEYPLPPSGYSPLAGGESVLCKLKCATRWRPSTSSGPGPDQLPSCQGGVPRRGRVCLGKLKCATRWRPSTSSGPGPDQLPSCQGGVPRRGGVVVALFQDVATNGPDPARMHIRTACTAAPTAAPPPARRSAVRRRRGPRRSAGPRPLSGWRCCGPCPTCAPRGRSCMRPGAA